MNLFTPLLTLESIALDMDAPSRKRAFEELSMIFERCTGIGHQEIFNALLAREKLGCTCLGGGVALPHGRVAGLKELTLAFLRTKTPVSFDQPDNRRARLFISVLIPDDESQEYLDILKQTVSLLKDRQAKEALLQAETPREVCEIIENWEAPVEMEEFSLEDFEDEETNVGANETSAQAPSAENRV